MDRKLTEADLATYLIRTSTGRDGDVQLYTVTAAYTASEPGWLLLKDHEHRVVAQFNQALVVMVERGDPAQDAVPSDEDRIRDAMAEARDHPGRTITR
jgi:hypothetical protein